MGRQLNFWMTADDEREFIDRLRQDDAVWTPYAIGLKQSPRVREWDEWSPVQDGQRLVIIRRPDWKRLNWEHIAECELPGFEKPFKPWTMVGTGPSPSFEWDSCVRGKRFIQRGRIYLRTTWLEGNRVLTKPGEPTRWFDRLCAWLRKRGGKGPYSRHYVMPGAMRAAESRRIELQP